MEKDQRKEFFAILKNSTSAELFRTIHTAIPERSFHLQNHILYDFRTLLGKEPKVYLEIGTYCGASALLMQSHPYPTEIHCVDPMNLDPSHFLGTMSQRDTIEKNIHNYPKPERVHLHQHFSHDKNLLQHFVDTNLAIDLLFIDGNHSYKMVIADFLNFSPFVNKGGFIIFDDYYDFQFSPQVKPAVDAIAAELKKNSSQFRVLGPVVNVQKVDKPEPKSHLGEFVIQKL